MEKLFIPYRICPIGAHSDHQHGLVSGFAINQGINLTYEPSGDSVCTVSSQNFPNTYTFPLNNIPERQRDWADHLRGAALSLLKHHHLTTGITVNIKGQLPIGGLSSSAAVIIAFISALATVNNIDIQPAELIDLSLQAENNYVGVSCGKLDQSCITYSRKDHLLYLDTKDDTYQLIPRSANCPPFEIAIFFSGIERTLADSGFNMRVDELKSAAYALMAYTDIPYGKFSEARLRYVPRDVFETYKAKLPTNWRKRATHFYTEFERVRQGVEAWKNGDLVTFGQLVFESGWSSIFNYETGNPQLIKLYDIMRDTAGIYGGRFSGAGFKGCCMALVNPEYKESIAEKVERKYLTVFPELRGKFSIHWCQTADGCGTG
ncbi:galactokinase [Clostridia bacterium]|nr:galactokinase [Clostridia bacterium]